MSRARRAGSRALPFALILVVALAALASAARRPSSGAPPVAGVAVLAATWPISTLVISEIQTGGASASDEFAEIHNAGSAAVDLAGLELVYVTSTRPAGTTRTGTSSGGSGSSSSATRT